MPEAPPDQLHTVQADIYIARRKRMHQVVSPAGVVVWSDPHLMNVFDWLAEKDINSAVFTDEESTFEVSFKKTGRAHPPEESK